MTDSEGLLTYLAGLGEWEDGGKAWNQDPRAAAIAARLTAAEARVKELEGDNTEFIKRDATQGWTISCLKAENARLRIKMTEIAAVSACVAVVENPTSHVKMLANINKVATTTLAESAALSPTQAPEADKPSCDCLPWPDKCPYCGEQAPEGGNETVPSLQYVIEGIILRRLHEKRVEGYTLEMSKEIAEAIRAPEPNAPRSLTAEEMRTAALNAINNKRMAEAGNFAKGSPTGDLLQGRLDALYDAFQLVRALPTTTQSGGV